MARDRCPAFDPVTAEQLLSGKGNAPVARLLAIASAPAQPGELAGEEAAVAAFRVAMQQRRQAGAVGTHRRRRSALPGRPAWTRLAGVKVGVAVALVVSGVAVAAGTGVLPLPSSDTKPWQQSTQRPTSAVPSESVPTLGPSGSTTTSVVGGSNRPASRTPTPSASQKPMPAPALVGLCRAYLAGPPDKPKATDNPAFAELIAAAGGVDNVPAFCESLLTPNPSGEPSGPPAGNQQLQPTGPPESPPKGRAEKKGVAGKGANAGNGNAEGSEGKGKGKEKKTVAQ